MSAANVATGIAFKQSIRMCTIDMWHRYLDATFFMLQNIQFNMLHQNLVCSFSRDNIEFSCTNLIGIVSGCLFTLYYAPHCNPFPAPHSLIYLCVASTYIEYEVLQFQTLGYDWNICRYINIDEVLSHIDAVRDPHPKDTYNFSKCIF